jgi:hypothetical protein
LNLIRRVGSVMTDHSVTSLPVPEVVGTAKRRDAPGGGVWPYS